ncbi:MAG: radical SAM protein [Pseudomonadota bacterium]
MTFDGGPEVFALPAADKFLLHGPRAGVTALVNRAARDELARALADPAGFRTPSRAGDELLSLFSVPPRPVEGPTGPLDPLFLGLVPTRSCNLSCGYCDFGSSRPAGVRMKPALAAAAVDWLAGHQLGRGEKRLEVHFFGGEPLVAGDVVDAAVHRTRAVAADLGLTAHLEISTNGYCDEQRAVFLGDYFNAVVLSLDGFRDSHDRHRPLAGGRGTFDVVVRTAGILSRSGTELCLRCCVSRENVDRLADIALWFGEDFQPGIINFETVCENDDSRAAGIHPPDPFVFAENFLKARRAARSFEIDAEYASSQPGRVRNSLCPLGNDAVLVFPDGQARGCYLPENECRKAGLDPRLGRLTETGTMEIDNAAVSRLRRLVAEKPLCRDCFCRWSCAGGCLVRQTLPDARTGTGDFCVQTRLIAFSLLLEELGRHDILEYLWRHQELLENTAGRPGFRLAPIREPRPGSRKWTNATRMIG